MENNARTWVVECEVEVNVRDSRKEKLKSHPGLPKCLGYFVFSCFRLSVFSGRKNRFNEELSPTGPGEEVFHKNWRKLSWLSGVTCDDKALYRKQT